MGLLNPNQQRDVFQQWRLPVNNSNGDAITSVSAEALTLYYYNSGVLTVDAGQAAGTVVVIKLANNNITTALGDSVGHYNDTSFSFGTGTILTTRVEYPYRVAEQYALQGGSSKANAITADFLNGQYCIDHENGVLYGKKATTGTSDTGSYKIWVNSQSSSGPTGNVNVAQWGGTATTLGQKVMVSSVPVTIASNQTSISVTPASPSTITSSTKTITASGTAEPLVGVSTTCKSVVVTGLNSNTGNAYVGGSTVDKTTNPGTVLASGDSVAIEIDDVAKVYADVDTNGEGVSFTYFN